MIFTIGYQRHTPEHIKGVLEHLDATLIDVRSTPSSRKPGFSKAALQTLLGERYLWAGNWLGGKLTHMRQEGIDLVAQYEGSDTEHCVLMCLENEPGMCHRHHAICGPFFPNALHIFEDVLVPASDIEAIYNGDEPKGTLDLPPELLPVSVARLA